MIDQSSLKTNFIGRDGFRWWVGQIPPLSSMGKQVEGGGWGNRFKVRIIGYHPYSAAELPDEDLPWAQCLIPTTAGSGAANCATGVQLQPSDIVLGFFLDGDNAQIPVILATFGRSNSVPSTDYLGPFVPFTGYSDKIQKNGGLASNESSEVKKTSNPSPRDVSPEQAKQISPDEKSTSDSIGSTVILANTINNTKVAGIKNEVSNLLKKIKRFLNKAKNVAQKIKQEIKKSVDKIVSIANDFVGSSFNFLYKQLEKLLKKGLDFLYKQVFSTILAATANPAAAHLAGVAAQTAMVKPVSILEKAVSCVAGAVISGLKSVVSGLLNSVVDNISRFVGCAAEQFTGSLLNSIIDKIESAISGPIAGVEKLLQFFSDFSVGGVIRSVVDGIKSVGSAFDCNQDKSSFQGLVNEWVVGSGPKFSGADPFQNILKAINIQNSTKPITEFNLAPTDSIVLNNLLSTVKIASNVGINDTTINLQSLDNISSDGLLSSDYEIMKINSVNQSTNQIVVQRAYSGITTTYTSGYDLNVIDNRVEPRNTTTTIKQSPTNLFKNSLGNCFTGVPTNCSAPTINIFGGGSSGSGATAIPLLGSIVGDTASIIGVKVTNGGSGYDYPPFVEIVDNCGQGYGAVARALINDAGQVESIYIVSEGENYPIENFIDIENMERVGGIFEYSVSDVVVDFGGSGYENGDTVVDNLGNTYSTQVVNGSIYQVIPLNNVVQSAPVLTVQTKTGSGAVLRPLLASPNFTGEVQQSIDCPTK